MVKIIINTHANQEAESSQERGRNWVNKHRSMTTGAVIIFHNHFFILYFLRIKKSTNFLFTKDYFISRLLVELWELKWDGVSHRYTRYCVIDCILSTTSCQKILKNCSPFVFVDWFFAFVDVLIPYVVHRIFTYRCENSHKNSHGIRDFRPISPRTSSLPHRSSIPLRRAHRHHRSRSSCMLWKVKRSHSRRNHAEDYRRVSLS